MGNLLRLLHAKSDEKEDKDIFIDFENVKPTEAEMETWQQVNSSCSSMSSILQELGSYGGATSLIREAVGSSSSEDNLRLAWQAVCPLVASLKTYYEYSLVLEGVTRQLLLALCSAEMTARQHLETQQALVKQFAEVIHFVLKFDELKVNNPSIQNDISFYRRTHNRISVADATENPSGVSTEVANKMSLFYAQSTPMLQMLVSTTNAFVAEYEGKPLENTTECLSMMANVCCTMVEFPEYRSKFLNTETVMFCLRVMVGTVILYDHISPAGAFAKTSSVDVKTCVRVLKKESATQTENKNDYSTEIESLMNALRYNSKHLTDSNTPKNIRQMFG